MPTYRVYALNDQGHIGEAPHVIRAGSDEEAIADAKQHLDGKDLEIWRGAHRISYLSHTGEAPNYESRRLSLLVQGVREETLECMLASQKSLARAGYALERTTRLIAKSKKTLGIV